MWGGRLEVGKRNEREKKTESSGEHGRILALNDGLWPAFCYRMGRVGAEMYVPRTHPIPKV